MRITPTLLLDTMLLDSLLLDTLVARSTSAKNRVRQEPIRFRNYVIVMNIGERILKSYVA